MRREREIKGLTRLGQVYRGLPTAQWPRSSQPLLAVRRASMHPSSNRTVSWGCSRRPASTQTRPRRPFFRSVSTAGRVSSLFDFENRKIGTGSSRTFTPHGSSSAPSSLAARSAHSPDRLRVLPARHDNRLRPRPLLPAGPVGLRARQPQHRHRSRLPKRGATPTSPAAFTNATRFWWIGQMEMCVVLGPFTSPRAFSI